MPKTVFVVSICVIPGLYGITGIFLSKEDAEELVKKRGGMVQEIPFNTELELIREFSTNFSKKQIMNKIKIAIGNTVVELETASSFVEVQGIVINFNDPNLTPPIRCKLTFVTDKNLIKDGWNVKIANIKAVRELTNCSLREAKELIESSNPVVFTTKDLFDNIKNIPGVMYTMEYC